MSVVVHHGRALQPKLNGTVPPSDQSEIYNISDRYFNGADKSDSSYFRLDQDFLAEFKGRKPKFGFNGLGEFVFYRTYSRLKADGQKETFVDVLTRVTEGCYEIQRRHCRQLHIPWDYDKAQISAQEMFRRMWDFKFLPPGRGLWMMGTKFMWERGSAALNNCFRASVEIITRDGVKPIGELVGTTQELLTINGEWVNAPIKSFGIQKLVKLVLVRTGTKKIIYTTANHRWFAKTSRRVDVPGDRADLLQDKSVRLSLMKGGTSYKEYLTTDLRPGMKMRSIFGQGIKGNVRPSVPGIIHGICFGDGTRGPDDPSAGSYIYLCGKKNLELLKYFGPSHTSFDPCKGKEGAIRVADMPQHFKDSPNLRWSKTYLYGFLAGYFAADGHISKRSGGAAISSSKLENLLMVRDICSVLGIGYSPIRTTIYKVRYKNDEIKEFVGYVIQLTPHHLREEFFLLATHRQTFERVHRKARGNNLPNTINWRVESVEETAIEEEVYCATVPNKHCFVLADNVLTGNCGMVSTDDAAESDPAEPFCFMMDMAMLGVGVGFDTKGAGKIHICQPNPDHIRVFVIPDSREGWVDSVRHLIRSYTTAAKFGIIEFDYTTIRPAGDDIQGFGGKASGPSILMELHNLLREHFTSKIGTALTSVDITDLMNYIGRCVVAGNVRRTAQVAFGEVDDLAYCSMKNPTESLLPEDLPIWNAADAGAWARMKVTDANTPLLYAEECQGIPAERLNPAIRTWTALNHHRWASNNSVFAKLGMNYEAMSKQIAVNGEPGFIWLDNVRDYGRMLDGFQPGIDGRVVGSNPCFAGGNRLLTKDGYVSLYDLWIAGGMREYDGPNDNMLGEYGQQQVINRNGLVNATNVYRTGINTPLWRVTFDDGSWIDATANHTFIVLDRSNHRVAGKKRVRYTERRISLSNLQPEQIVPLNQTVHFGMFNDTAYAELAGWCIGDGSLSPLGDGQTRAVCTFYNSDAITVQPRLRGLMLELYETHNKSSHQHPICAGWNREQAHFDHDEIRIGSNVLGRLLRNDGITNCHKHHVPNSIWSGTRETVAAFLRGLASADGFALVSNNGTISVRISQSCQPFLQECRLLLNQFGIASTVQFRRKAGKRAMNDGKGGKKLYNRKAHYELIVSGMKQVRKFMDNIGFIQDWKMTEAREWLSTHHGSNNSDTGKYVKVRSIVPIDNADTFCLTEPGNNQVVIEGYQVGQCLEQSLESYELCCLVESFPANHDSAEDFMRTLKFAYLYAKTVTLLPTHNRRTNQVTLRNRRIGLSQSGIIQAFAKFGRRAILKDFCDAGYNEIRRWDQIYSDWLCVTRSIKVTSVKPSGTVSLVVGATPGIHHPEAMTYWRTVRVAKDSILVKILARAGYRIEPALSDKERTVVIYFGVDDRRVRPVTDVGIWEQAQNVADYQKYWADNQVSCTIKFKPHESHEIARVTEAYEDQWKGIAFLPHETHGYQQAPYIPCEPTEIAAYNANLSDTDYSDYLHEATGAMYCDSEKCSIPT